MATERNPVFSELHGYFVKDAYARERLEELAPVEIKTNGFVTPQMFGAVADGITDDAEAIQAAIDSGKDVYFPKGVYSLNSTIEIVSKDNFTLDASNAIFKYNNNDYAFYFRAIQDCTIRFNEIECTDASGGCIHMYGLKDGTLASDYIQYLNLEIHNLKAGDNGYGIFVDQNGESWINEIRLRKTRLEKGAHGIYFFHNSNHGMSHWIIQEVGVEGVSNGFKFERSAAAVANNKHFTAFVFENLRTAEATSVMQTDGCTCFEIHGAYDFKNKIIFDGESTKWRGSYTYGGVGSYQVIDGKIINTTPNNKALMGLIEIPAGDDLDDYTIPGEYYVVNNTTAQNVENCPSSYSGRLTVHYGINDNYYTYQTYEELTNAKGQNIYKRVKNRTAETWGEWQLYRQVKTYDLGNHTIPANGAKEITLDTTVLAEGNYLVNIDSNNNAYWSYVGIMLFRNRTTLADIVKGNSISVSMTRTASSAGTLTITNGDSTANTVNVSLTRLE